MGWWDDPNDYNSPPPVPDNSIDWVQKTCNHEWKETVLIVSKVYDCVKCKLKKEEYEHWEASKWEL